MTVQPECVSTFLHPTYTGSLQIRAYAIKYRQEYDKVGFSRDIIIFYRLYFIDTILRLRRLESIC